MFKPIIFATLFFLHAHAMSGNLNGLNDLMTNFTVHLVKTQQTVLFGCSRQDLLTATAALMQSNQVTQVVHLGKNYTLNKILTRYNHAKTSAVVDCRCNESLALLKQASDLHYFNKTYQWLLCDPNNMGIAQLLPQDLDYLGPNAQVTYVNGSQENYMLWDIHSKGLHLNSPLEVNLIAEWRYNRSGVGYFVQHIDVFEQQSIRKRGQFNRLTLRGAAVIDQDNITTNEQIVEILSHDTKDPGVATFINYHYNLVKILSDRFNFTVNFRNSRGWAGRLGNTTYRLGLLGVVMRDEADLPASGAFTRINRFAEFDTIHQSWKFESGFLYRFTPELDAQSKNGNFLAPFDDDVWYYAIAIMLMVNFLWYTVEWLRNRWHLNGELKQQQQEQNIVSESAADTATAAGVGAGDEEAKLTAVSLKTFAAVCQQGMEPLPTALPTRTIVLTMFVFSLFMYNFYTSSVVGGLLSNTAQGLESIAEVIASPLKLSFEDIGYYKIMFREAKTPLIKSLHKVKILPQRNPSDLPVYTHVEDAIPYIKQGGYAFHCELIDAYPGIAKLFDVDDICDLRMVSGLLESEIINWIVPKRSQYTEFFRTTMNQAREAGLVTRTLDVWRAKKPQCQALYRVFPITLPGVLSAFFILLAGYLGAGIALFFENRKYKRSLRSNMNKEQGTRTLRRRHQTNRIFEVNWTLRRRY